MLVRQEFVSKERTKVMKIKVLNFSCQYLKNMDFSGFIAWKEREKTRLDFSEKMKQ